jgi:UDP-sulfoquinovose synthase
VLELAELVRAARASAGAKVEIEHLADPRVEAEEHYYNAKHSKLTDLGLRSHLLSDSLLDSLIDVAMRYRERIDPSVLLPQISWRNGTNRRQAQMSAAAFVP